MAKTKTKQLLEKLFETIGNLGVNGTLDVLEREQSKHDEKIKVKIDFIISKACESFEISKFEIFNSRTNNIRTEALAICYYVIQKKVGLISTHIADFFEKNIAQISRGIKRINELSPTSPADKKIKERMTSIMELYDREFN